MLKEAQDRLQKRLEAQEKEQTWKPEPGETLVGTVINVTTRSTSYGSSPVIVVQDDAGDVHAWWGFHAVARKELSRVRPRVGETIAIRRLPDGKGTQGRYRRFAVAVDRETEGVDWDTVAEGVEDLPDEDTVPGPYGGRLPLPQKPEPAGDDEPSTGSLPF